MRSFALEEPKSPRMSLTLDAVENNGLSPSHLLIGEEHAREIFAICASLRRTAEGDSHGNLYPRCCGLDVGIKNT
jgi:hypothetical protein